MVVNDTLGTIDQGRLWLNVNGTKYDLTRYQGPVDGPRLLGPFAVASRDSIVCEVIARSYTAKTPPTGQKSIGLEGKISGEPIHFEMKLSS